MEFFLLFVLATVALILGIAGWSRICSLKKREDILDQALRRLHKRLDELEALRPLDRAKVKAEATAQSFAPQPLALPVPSPVQAKPTQLSPVPQSAAQDLKPHAREPYLPKPAVSPLSRSPSAPSWKMPSFDWESLVGVKLFSWVAGVSLLLGAVFFLRYSMDRGWLMPPVRIAIGVIVGIGLLILCEVKAARRFPATANAMDGSAIAILFSTFFAAHALWHLVGTVPTFLLLVLVTATAVLLSIRRDSIFIALLGLAGGFATPALLSTGENSPISLFGYLLLLNAGLAWVAARKKWPLLTTLSLAFTTLYQCGWVMKFLTAGQLSLSVGIFLVFPVLAFSTMAVRPKEQVRDWKSLYGQTANIGAMVPLVYSLYLAAVPGYGSHYGVLFGFLFLLDAGLYAVALASGQDLLHLAGAFSTLVVFAVWMKTSYTGAAWPLMLPFAGLFVLFYLGVPILARRLRRGFQGLGSQAVYAASLLLFVFPTLASIEPNCASPGLLFIVLYLLLASAAAYAVQQGQGAVYFIAAFMALVAEVVWSAKHLIPERLLSALALYGAFALFYLAVPWAARRWNKALKPEAGGAMLVLAALGLLFFFAAGPVAGAGLWGLGLLLLFVNIGLTLEGSACRHPLIAVAGVALSWIVLAVSWSNINLSGMLVPALVVVSGFAILAIAGNIWLQEQAAGARNPALSKGIFLGLAGHLFLLVIAGQKSLAVPPWPLLSALLILDLAVGVAALYTKEGGIHLGSSVVSALVLMVWVSVATAQPWPMVAAVAAGVLVLFKYIWMFLSDRLGIQGILFRGTAAGSVFLAQMVLMLSAAQEGSPSIGVLIMEHLALLAALLWLARACGWHILAIAAALSSACAASFWQVSHLGPEFWRAQLFFSGSVYLAFLVYPVLVGRRAGRAHGPYSAAVLASTLFFFLARGTMLQTGWGNVIGILPVSQALLLSLLLVRLLRLESPGARNLGRLALVAGAVLAFVTVAIPLQLEKEWITIGWALEGSALAWLFGRIPHKGLLFSASGLLAAVFVRLTLNPSVLIYAPHSSHRIWNWYLYTYLISATTMILAGWLLSKSKDRITVRLARVVPFLHAAGTILLFLLLNIEIADFYSEGAQIIFRFSATLAQDLTYTLGWALFALVLLVVGIAIRSQAARNAALGLLLATILKCFLHDLARLGGFYRVMSFVGLAVCLALVAMVLQKYVLSGPYGRKTRSD